MNTVITNTPTLTERSIDPLNTLSSLILFLGPALLVFLSFHGFRILLLNAGMHPFDALVTSMTVPMAIILVLPLIGFQMEKQKDPTLSFSKRFRYGKFSWKYIIYGFIGYLVINIGYGICMQINLILINAGIITYPSDTTPLFDPKVVVDMSAFENFIGAPMYHNWRVFVLYLVMLIMNVVAEELWWRGYILPRQEAHYGRYTWMVHGLMWNVFHIFKWWDLLPLLPVTLCIAFLAQKKRENWTPFIMHLLMNGMFVVFMLQALF